MAIIIKDYANSKGITSDLYVKIDSLHNIGEAENKQVVLNTSQWISSEAREGGNAEPLFSNAVFIVKDREIASCENLINAGYQLLKADLIEKGYTVEDDLNDYGEQLKANEETEAEKAQTEQESLSEN